MSVERATTIRPASADDFPAIEALLHEAELPTAGVRALLQSNAHDFFVATGDSEHIEGVAGLEVCGQTALLRSVAVRASARRRGLGHELVRRVVCHAESRGIRALYLLTTTAEHYFPRFGFERIERGAVPKEIADTLEFKSACPDTAAAMVRELASGVSAG